MPERERERERDRETERQRDRETERQRDRETETEREENQRKLCRAIVHLNRALEETSKKLRKMVSQMNIFDDF